MFHFPFFDSVLPIFFTGIFLLVEVFGCVIAFGAHILALLTEALPHVEHAYLNLRTFGAQICLRLVPTAPQNSQTVVFSCGIGAQRCPFAVVTLPQVTQV